MRSLADESPVSQIAEGAKKLYRRVQKTHQGADELHHGIEATHHSLSALHGPATGDDLEELQILVEDKTPANSRPFPIVGIGASAGGFEAFLALLRSLSTDSGMAFVLVQHLDPHHRSKLGELLAHSTKIPIINATDGMEVESDHIYVIPENTSMTIAKGQLHLAPRGEKEMPPMPIDAFFRSLAKEQHDLAIGVVLSGTGTDGTLGIEAIKGEGGITFAQDERSAKYEGMPRSAVATGVVDFVLPPARIAEELQQIARHPYVERKSKRAGAGKADHTGETDYHDLNEVFSLLRARTGVDFSFYKQSTLKRRIARRMVLHKMDKMGEYVALIAANPEEIDALFDDLLINVTSFFRDPKLFEMFHKKVFPRLIKEHGDGSALRMWVCGCATGEEAYSLAMCLLEFFDETRTHLPVQIFATDISESSIEKARAGLYPENIAQDVSAERLRRFFSKADGQYRVHKAIRDMVVFARQNVVIDPPFSKLDLVSCRNVLIYFGPVLQRQVMPMFHYSLRPNGYLVLGGSETIGGVADRFALIDTKHKIYQKKASLSAPAAYIQQAPEEQPRTKGKVEALGPIESSPVDLNRHADHLLLQAFSPAAVVVDAHMEIVHFRGNTDDFLAHPPGAASLNIFKMTRESLVIPLRSALSKAGREERTIRQPGVEYKPGGRHVSVTIEVWPFKLGPARDRFFLVVFQEVAQPPQAPPSSNLQRRAGERREIKRLSQELEITKDSLRSIIEEQEGTNEELKSANEEIQSSNEELQSTNEELETAKEELQSTNEELTTLNEELQTRNTELSLVNNDLTNLLASVNVAILMLDQDLNLRRYTPLAERIFDIVPSDLGRRLSAVNRSLLLPDLDATIREVIDNLAPVEREARDRDGHWYLLRVRPYRTRENKIEGAVLLLVDIDDVRRALDVVMSIVKHPLMMLGADLQVRNANQAFYESFGLAPAEVIGRKLSLIGDGQWDIPELRKMLLEVLPRSNQVLDFVVEAGFRKGGVRRLQLNAKRFFEESQTMQLILLSVQDMASGGKADSGVD